MAYNVPTYDTKRFSFGPGVLYVGIPGTTPLTEIGAVKGDSELSVERTKLEVWAGSPLTKIAEYVTKEEAVLKTIGIEWNLDNLNFALGAGVTGGSDPEETFEFGGDMEMSNRAVRFIHRTADGSTIDIHLFNCQGIGKLAISFKETDMHEFPYEFHTLEGTSDFSNALLADKKKQFKIIRTKA